MQISGRLNSTERTETEPEISAEKTQLVFESKPHANHVMKTSTDLEIQARVAEKQKVLNESSALKRMVLIVSVMSIITIFVVNYVTMDFRKLSASQEWREMPQNVWKNVRMRNYLKDCDKKLLIDLSIYGGFTFLLGRMAFTLCAAIKTLFTKKAEIIECSSFWHWKACTISLSIMVFLKSIFAGFFAANFYSLCKEFLAVLSTLKNV